jgi:FkbM family methyltransferase
MSTKYFLYVKSANESTDSDKKSQIFFPNSPQTFLLPQVNMDYYNRNGLFEKGLIEWCKQFGNGSKVMLDIGAHTGTYSLCLASLFKEVHSFEPQKMTYYALCGSVALSSLTNVTCHQVGLGDSSQVGTQTLNIVSNDGGGSSLHATGAVIKQETIEIKTLDSLNLDNIGFIKMDVEENELYVLKGAVNTLRQSGFPKILFESNSANEPLFNFLKELGYGIIKINGFNNMFLASSAS